MSPLPIFDILDEIQKNSNTSTCEFNVGNAIILDWKIIFTNNSHLEVNINKQWGRGPQFKMYKNYPSPLKTNC